MLQAEPLDGAAGGEDGEAGEGVGPAFEAAKGDELDTPEESECCQ